MQAQKNVDWSGEKRHILLLCNRPRNVSDVTLFIKMEKSILHADDFSTDSPEKHESEAEHQQSFMMAANSKLLAA